jgi:hypothetical protein
LCAVPPAPAPLPLPPPPPPPPSPSSALGKAHSHNLAWPGCTSPKLAFVQAIWPCTDRQALQWWPKPNRTSPAQMQLPLSDAHTLILGCSPSKYTPRLVEISSRAHNYKDEFMHAGHLASHKRPLHEAARCVLTRLQPPLFLMQTSAVYAGALDKAASSGGDRALVILTQRFVDGVDCLCT